MPRTQDLLSRSKERHLRETVEIMGLIADRADKETLSLVFELHRAMEEIDGLSYQIGRLDRRDDALIDAAVRQA